MQYVFLLAGIALAAFGAYLLADFALWEAKGKKTGARIEGFMPGRFLRLPILSFIAENGKEMKAEAERINQLVYLLSRPKEGDAVTIIYMEEENASPPLKIRARVHGYLPAALGGLLMLPLLAALGMMAGKAVVAAQVVYVMLFAGIIFGALALLKMIYRN